RKPSRNSSRANSTNSCISVSPRRFLNETKCDMDDPPQGRNGAECSSPVGTEDVVAGGRAGRVEGRRAATGGDGAGTAVDQDDIDAGGREALRQCGTGCVYGRGDLEGHGGGLGLPTRVIPPVPVGLPGGGLAAESDGVARLRVALGEKDGIP